MVPAPSSSAEPARLIDGRAIAAAITMRVAAAATRLKGEAGVTPGLAVVLVGDDPASRLYVSGKGRKAEEVGFHSVQHNLPASTGESELLALVGSLNRDPAIHGILVQFPLPAQIDRMRVIEAIAPDNDGFQVSRREGFEIEQQGRPVQLVENDVHGGDDETPQLGIGGGGAADDLVEQFLQAIVRVLVAGEKDFFLVPEVVVQVPLFHAERGGIP